MKYRACAQKRGRCKAASSVRCVPSASRYEIDQAVTPALNSIRTSLTAYAVNSLDIGSPPFNC